MKYPSKHSSNSGKDLQTQRQAESGKGQKDQMPKPGSPPKHSQFTDYKELSVDPKSNQGHKRMD